MRTDARPMLKPKGTGGQKVNNLLFGGPARALKSNTGRTGAMVFPYTPTITYQRGANYGTYDLPHTNYQPVYYQNTASPTVQVTGLFTNQTEDELRYTQGCLHFLRMASLSHFGEKDTHRGTPPPVLLFSAYGANQFSNWPCVVANVSYTLDSEIDYVESGSQSISQQLGNQDVGLQQGLARIGGVGRSNVILPAQMFIAIDLRYQPDLMSTRKDFSLSEMANGSLLDRGFV
tara:strand:- start:61 stop:756 length:696 start_codon:yes stop_codon:yes gene_type:complete